MLSPPERTHEPLGSGGTVRYTGRAFRAHHPNWAWSPTSGEGARIHGGRFNPKGVPALYLSLDLPTAILEASQGFAFRIPPLTIVEYDVDSDDLVDLTARGALRRHGTTAAELGGAWLLLARSGEPVPTWQVAERLIADGAAGVVVPSFAPGASARSRNLVLWRWGDTTPHRVVVFDPDGRLKRS